MAEPPRQSKDQQKGDHGKSMANRPKVPVMKPGDALRKARQIFENGKVSFHEGHLSRHLGEEYQGHVFEKRDIYYAMNDPFARVIPAKEFFHQSLKAFIYELYGKSAGIPIRVAFYFTADPDTGEILMILTGFIDVPESKRIKNR